MGHFNIPFGRAHKRSAQSDNDAQIAATFRKRQSRLTPAEIASMQSELSASAAKAVSYLCLWL
jgi:hypothetical protein